MSSKKKEDILSTWSELIKNDKLREVMIDTKERLINSNQALEGIIRIGVLAYKHCKNSENFCSSPNDTLNLTLYFNSFFLLNQTKDADKYLRSIYHIANFFYETNNLEHITSLYKIILKFKNDHAKIYNDEAKSLHSPFIHLIQKSILKLVESESTHQFNTSVVSTLLQTQLELSIIDNVLHDGTSFLKILLRICYELSSKEQKAALQLTSSGLVQLYKVETIKVLDSTLPLLLSIYETLLHVQLKITGYMAALHNLESHINQIKWKYKDDLKQAKCFGLLSNTVKILTWNCTESDDWLLEKIQHSNKILESFGKIPLTECLRKTCSLTHTIVANFSVKNAQKLVSSFPSNCFIPFLKMVESVGNLMKIFEFSTTEAVQCFTEVFVLILKFNPEENIDRLKKCTRVVRDVCEATMRLLLVEKNTTNSGLKVGSLVSLFLSRFTSLLLKYHKTELSEEVISLSKPVCKFICLLPPETIDTNNKKALVKLCFTPLICAFGTQRLNEVMECVTMLLCYLPECTDDIFRLLGDMKHNAIVGGVQLNLETTIWTVISEKSSTLERDWLPCKLREDEIASFSMQELITYSVNKSLRGSPVIAAAEALFAQDIDVFTQVKAFVIALDVASVSSEFPDHFLKYYSKSEALIAKLRKEKTNFDPVDFNCWMANLMYMQLRCFLKDLRTNCEAEIVRLSATVAPTDELPEDRPDPNDSCDLTTRCNSLSLVEQRKLLNNFDSILRHWGFACALANDPKQRSVYDWRVTLTFVHEAGTLLKLYFDQVKMKNAWDLLYSMATLTKNVDFIVTAVAELLVVDKVNETWLETARKYLEHQDLTMSVKSSFMISSAIHHLNNNQIVEGLKLLSELEPSANKNSIQYTEFLITLGLYQKLEDWHKYHFTFDCSPSYHFSFHKAIGYLLYLAEHKKWVGGFAEVCKIHQQLLKVSYLLGEANYDLEQPREARRYLTTSLPFAQKLALPLSTVQLVLALAWVDFNTGLTDDCAVKLTSLEDLLELCTTPPSYSNPNTSPSAKSVMTTPEYLNHPPGCNCLACNNDEYKRLVLETITLRATFCAEFGSQSHAQECFQVAIQVQEDLGESKRGEVMRSQARLWLKYGDMLIRKKMMKEAALANSKASQLLSNIDETILSQLVLEQTRLIEFSILDDRFMPKRLFIETENVETPKKMTASINSPAKTFNTPKNILLKGKSPLATVSNNEPITPFVTRKKIIFKLPSSGEENTPPTPPRKSSRLSKVRPRAVVETPFTCKQVINSPSTSSESKLRTKSKALPKFLLKTPSTTKSAAKKTKNPFPIYDDSSFSLSEPKSSSTRKKELNEKPICKELEPTKKVLFPPSSSGKTKDFSEDLDSFNIVRKSKKASGLKTYGKSKLQDNKEPEFKHPASNSIPKDKNKNSSSTMPSEKNNSFSFKEMKKVLNESQEPVRKVNLRKGVSASLLKEQTSESNISSTETLEKKRTKSCNSSQEDSDIVEGTPSPPSNRRIRIEKRKVR